MNAYVKLRSVGGLLSEAYFKSTSIEAPKGCPVEFILKEVYTDRAIPAFLFIRVSPLIARSPPDTSLVSSG